MRGRKWATEDERREAVREAQRRYRERNRARVRATQRAYIERHPERRKSTLKASFQKLRADPERYARFLAQGRESYARHPEAGYLYALNWRSRNRERVRANSRDASSRRWDRVGSTSKAVSEYAPTLRRDPCAYCGGPASVVDHIVPLAGGGNHAWENLTGACRRCNASKHARSLLTFLLAAA